MRKGTQDMSVLNHLLAGATRSAVRVTAIAAIPLLMCAGPIASAAGGGHTTLAALEYREGHREAAIARRADFMQRMESGLAVITSADRSQPNLYEFYTPD